MQKIIILIILFTFFGVFYSFKNKIELKTYNEICFKIKNDTGASVTLHTGKGTAAMPNNTTKEFCMEEGKKLHLADKGQKGKVIVMVSNNISGKILKLSQL